MVGGSEKQCSCYAMACHPGHDETMTRVHFTPKVGGKGVHAWLSIECMKRRSGQFTVPEGVMT